jgi:hypothetical protein
MDYLPPPPPPGANPSPRGGRNMMSAPSYSMSGGGRDGQLQAHPDAQIQHESSKRADNTTAMLKQSRSGIRRFSATSMPFLHNQNQNQNQPLGMGGSPMSPMNSYNSSMNMGSDSPYDDGRETQSKALQHLSESVADMYNGINKHVKKIRSFQKKSDSMVYGANHMDHQSQGQMQAPQPAFDVAEIRGKVEALLSEANLIDGKTLIWHKNQIKRKWSQETFHFRYPREDSTSSPSIQMVIGDDENDTFQFSSFSHGALNPEETTQYDLKIKKTSKRSKKAVRKLYELHVCWRGFPNRGNMPGILIFQTPEQRNAVQAAIDSIVKVIKDFNRRKTLVPTNTYVDPQIMADKAQCFEAYGAGLFDAVVGEPASFEILAKDEFNQPMDQYEMGKLLPPTYDPRTEEWTEGHGGSDMRLNIQLFSVTKEEHEAGDYSRLEYEKMDDKDLISGGEQFQRAKNIDAHQYDLTAKLKMLDDDDGDDYADNEWVFECNYTIARVGYYCLFVQLGRHHIRGSPFFDLTGMPGSTHAKSSVAYGPGLVVANPHTINSFTIEARDRLGNARGADAMANDDVKDQFIIGVVGPATIEMGKIEAKLDDYVSWRGGVIDNNNGTYTVNYKVNNTQKALAHPGAEIQIYIKIDDGTMFNKLTMDKYRVVGEQLADGLIPGPLGEPWEQHESEMEPVQYDEEGYEIDPAEEYDSEDEENEHLPHGWKIKYDDELGQPYYLNTLTDERQDYEPQDIACLPRPVEASRVNIVGSPFCVTISDHLPSAASEKRLRAHRPAAPNDSINDMKQGEIDTKTDAPSSFTSSTLSSAMSYGSPAPGPAPGTPSNHELEAKARQLQQWEDSIRRQQEELQQEKQRFQQGGNYSNSPNNYPSTPLGGASKAASKTEEPPIVTPSVRQPVNIAAKAPAAAPAAPAAAAAAASGDTMTPEASSLFRKNRQALQSLYDTYASNSDGLSLESFFSMCSDFDLFPTFLNRDGIVTCYGRACKSGGSINFEEFTNALYEVAMHSLSKSTFQELYPTPESKVSTIVSIFTVTTWYSHLLILF